MMHEKKTSTDTQLMRWQQKGGIPIPQGLIPEYLKL